MADIRDSAAFKAVAAQVIAELLTRGLDVLEVTVVNMVAEKVRQVAEQAGMSPKAALGYIDPSVIAGHIAAFAAGSHDGNSAVRPVRLDVRKVLLPRQCIGLPMMALAQAAKYANSNGAEPTVSHAADLFTELGEAIGSEAADGGDRVAVPVGVLTETADIIDRAATRIESGDWSSCPCGQDHGQGDLDAKVAGVLRRDAGVARQFARLV